MPRRPLELTTTVCTGPGIAVPVTPARYAALCVPWVPIRIVLESGPVPLLPISMLSEPAVSAEPALEPIAMLRAPLASFSASWPTAVLSL